METKEIESAVEAKLAEWGIEYSARFVPFSNSRNSEEKQPSLNWSIVFDSVDCGAFRADFSQGIGHIPGYDSHYACSVDGNAMYRNIAEDGYIRGAARTSTRDTLPAPSPASVLYCLLSDAEAVGYTFEDWASNYGYDTDSRKAEAAYRACLSTALGLKRVLEEWQQDELRQLMEDY